MFSEEESPDKAGDVSGNNSILDMTSPKKDEVNNQPNVLVGVTNNTPAVNTFDDREMAFGPKNSETPGSENPDSQ